jgi:hypothetical protein
MDKYIRTLSNYINKNGYTILEGSEARKKFRESVESSENNIFKEICGSIIYDTLGDFVFDKNNIIYIIVKKNTQIPTSIFVGYIEKNENEDEDKDKDEDFSSYIESSYTCSHIIPSGGDILRCYAMVKQHAKNKNITELSGVISGGIPAIIEDDNIIIEMEKRERLKNYHIKNGAKIIDGKFYYTIESILRNIEEKYNDQDFIGGFINKKSNRKKTRKSNSKSNSKSNKIKKNNTLKTKHIKSRTKYKKIKYI